MIFTIKSKILGGYGTILFLLITIAAVAYFSLTNIQKTLTTVIENKQPKAVASLEISNKIFNSSSNLAFFMLSTAELDKSTYLKSIKAAKSKIEELKSLARKTNDKASIIAVGKLEALIAKLDSYQETMFRLASNREENLPALTIATQQLEPMGDKLLQLASDIVLSPPDTDDPEELAEIALTAHDLRFHWAMVISNVRSYLAFRDNEMLSEINLYKSGSNQLIESLSDKEDELSEEQVDALDELIDLKSLYFISFDKAYEVHSGEQWRTDSYIVRTEVGPLLHKIEADLETLLSMQQASIDSASKSLQEQVINTVALLSSIVIIATLLSIIIAYLSATRIITPLRDVVTAMQELASTEGDLTKRLKTKTKDELGQLSTAFNFFISKVLTMVTSISNVGNNVKGSTLNLTNVSKNTNQQMMKLKEEAQQVNSAVSQMSSSVEEVSTSANASASATQKADEEANVGSQVVNETIDVINQLNIQFIDSAEKISHLDSECDKISNVIDSIKEIADTTNLLSLNAAIEAARAGESGRGFAVVADEVRNLALRTQNSTAEIQQSIEKLQSDSKSAVQAMEQGKMQVELCVEKAALAGDSLSSINELVATINDMNSQVANAVKEQNIVFSGISGSIEHISLSSDEIFKESEITASESAHLEGLSNELVELVSHFKLESSTLNKDNSNNTNE